MTLHIISIPGLMAVEVGAAIVFSLLALREQRLDLAAVRESGQNGSLLLLAEQAVGQETRRLITLTLLFVAQFFIMSVPHSFPFSWELEAARCIYIVAFGIGGSGAAVAYFSARRARRA